MPIQPSLNTTAQSNPDADQALAAWQWEGGAPAPRSAPHGAMPSGGHWSILLTLLGDSYALRGAANQGGYTWDHGFWTHVFTGSWQPNADPDGARLLQEWVEQEARQFEGAGQMTEPRFVPVNQK